MLKKSRSSTPAGSFRRSAILAAGIALIMVAMVVACAPQAPTNPTAVAPATAVPANPTAVAPATSKTQASSASPQQGGRIVLSWNTDVSSLAPYQQVLVVERYLEQHLFDTLVAYDEVNRKFVPGLAKSWDVSADGKAWTFKLREDVTFHDGTPFNAEAVKFTFDWIMDSKSKAAPFSRGYLTGYLGSEVVDNFTVKVAFSDVPGRFLDGLVVPNLGMVSPTAIKKYGDDFGAHPVGTGSFMFKEWMPNDHISLVRNPNYTWGPAGYSHPGPAYLDELLFRPIKEDATRSAALTAGEVDVAYLSFADAPRFRGDSKTTLLVAVRPGTVRGIYFNLSAGPASDALNDIAVRRAIAYAIDRNAITNAPFFGGAAVVAKTPLAPTMFGYDAKLEDLALPYDVERSKKALDDAGWKIGSAGIREKDGKRLTLKLIDPNLTFLGDVAQLIQGQLKVVGIDLSLQLAPDWTTVMPQIQKGDYDVMIAGSFQADMGLLNVNFDPSQIGQSALLFARFPDEQLAQLLKKGSGTIDPQGRLEVYGQVQKLLLEKLAIVPIYVEPYVFGYNPKIQGIRLSNQSEPRFQDAYLAK